MRIVPQTILQNESHVRQVAITVTVAVRSRIAWTANSHHICSTTTSIISVDIVAVVGAAADDEDDYYDYLIDLIDFDFDIDSHHANTAVVLMIDLFDSLLN